MDRSEPADAGPPDPRRLLADVEAPGFEVAFRGYDPAQVHALLDRVAAGLRAATDRTTAAEPGGEVLAELVQRVADEVQRFRAQARADADRVTAQAASAAAAVLAEAEERAGALLATARDAAAEVLATAQAEAAAVRARVAAEASVVTGPAAAGDRPPGPGTPPTPPPPAPDPRRPPPAARPAQGPAASTSPDAGGRVTGDTAWPSWWA